ncbi:MAG: leucine--tRNA ligase [Candidatus Lloydbacteria bacterium RIFCSPHIGHO2_02_FULL_50_13]|uniref:Leucine--tRNA ligase n=1 Tax=Candidatus Lloydbacteria bacterium RIFCSPHIGHO2_02_FULL_50_13 TaxID=1798661 RepID=A0A1G2D0Y4_9BACT|nr:MAG: leucine--tRNA ligase [Candidatus Lloydbacteria bacterium RIFCSPHIGHO2_02_FULL_50_13]
MKEYDHKKIEQKWQKHWAEEGLYKSHEDPKKPKCYVLDEFPYPSGEGLHAGHARIYTASDIYARMKRMQGFTVLHPTGWDAFGLPAELFAIKNKVHPAQSVKKNTEHYHEQMDSIGLSYDWDREINTTDPAYYKWTQWAFLKMLERGLAYESFEPINWCPTCQTGLANEDLNGGNCERCDTPVEKKPMRQWVIRITQYANRLIDDLDTLSEWPDAIKEAQKNWIGRSEGATIQFPISNFQFPNNSRYQNIEVFTTRPDTLFGATYVAISAELAKKWLDSGWRAGDNVQEFIEKTLKKEAGRAREVIPEKEGIATGIFVENPVNKEKIPVWVANYVLSGYGTGAIMAVPAHDDRDFEFASKFNLPIRPVVLKPASVSCSFVMGIAEEELNNVGVTIIDGTKDGFFKVHIPFNKLEEYKKVVREKMSSNYWNEFSTANGFYFIFKHKDGHLEELDLSEETNDLIDRYGMTFNDKEPEKCAKNVYSWLAGNSLYKPLLIHTDPGVLVNSWKFNGKTSEEAKALITQYIGGKMTTTYKLKDWVFSRQRYWGEPIPIVHCEKDGVVPVPESELPVMLPDVKSYAPTGTGESPLAAISDWVNVLCPKCGGPAKRETNTMPQWAGSSWYYLRFMDPHNSAALVGKNKEKYWAPVDVYVGGAEHVTRHLIYARFWHKFLYDIGVVSTIEPFLKRKGVGLVLGEGGVKMSKRLGNVINPDDIIEQFGTDSLRIYVMFMGPFGQAIAWSTDNLIGARRFIERVWRIQGKVVKNAETTAETEILLHQTIKKVGEDIERFAFNTAISQLMIFLNHLEKLEHISRDAFHNILLLISPFAPHIAEELWHDLGEESSVQQASWPKFDENKTRRATINIAIQVNGKLRGTLNVASDITEEAARKSAGALPEVGKWLDGKTVKRIVYVSGRTINFVVE